MTPKDFYLSEKIDFDALDFKRCERLDPGQIDPIILMNLPKGNTVSIEAPIGFFLFAWAKVSKDKKTMKIASLSGSVEIGIDGLDASRMIGIAGSSPGRKELFQGRIAPSEGWSRIDGEEFMDMKARKKSSGAYEPIHLSVAFRGLSPGVRLDHYVWLPGPPTEILKTGFGAEIKSEGFAFQVEDKQVALAILDGSVHWVLPDADGNFRMP